MIDNQSNNRKVDMTSNLHQKINFQPFLVQKCDVSVGTDVFAVMFDLR